MLKETSPQVPIQTTSFRQSLEVISEYNASFLIFCFALLLGVLSLFDIVLPANVLLAISFVFPVFVTERAWITNHTSEVQFMKQLVSKFKTMFMAGGIVLSVSTLFYFPLLVINPFPFQSISGNVIWLSIAFFLALTLSLILLIPSFYKIQNEEPTTHVIYRLVSSSDQLIALGVIMYAFTSFATISFIEVLKFATFSLEQNLVTNVEIYFREFSYFLALVFYFLMLLLSLYIFITIISFYFIRDGRLSLPSRDILMFVMRRMLIGLLTFLVAIFLIPLISGNLGLLWITVGFNIGLSVYLMNRKLDGEICDKCHSIKIEHPKPLCINCDVETNVKIPFKLPNVRQVRVPQCPSCGKIWDSPTRQCSNCRYTVILACPNCGQTLNPLWTNCVKCKVGLTPMPKKALETKGHAGFQKSTIGLVMFTGFSLIASVVLIAGIIIILSFLGTLDSRGFGQSLTIRSFYILIAYGILGFVMILAFLSSVIVFIKGSDRNLFPIFLISSKLFVIAPGTIFLYYVIANLFGGWLLANIVFFLIFVYTIYSQYRKLLEFTPKVSIRLQEGYA